MPHTGGAGADLDLTLAELALGLADVQNVAQFLGASGNRFADSFDALTYVDTAGASNLDTGTAGLLKPTSSATSYANAGGSGNRSGSVTVSIAGFSQYAGSAAGNLVNGDTTADGTNDFGFGTNGASCAGYEIRFDFGAQKYVDEYKWYQQNAAGQGSWKLQGANASDYSDAADLHAAEALVTGATTTHSVISPGLYRYYRLVGVSGTVTAPSGGTWCTEVEFKIGTAAPGATNLTVTSTALTAATAPATARLVARVKEVDAVTLNTDIVASASRDGGSNWDAFTLSKRFTSNGISVYESAALDLSGQPSGTAVKWQVATANNTMVEIHDVYLYWT
ncbi:MAG: hypothetical protein AB7O50_09370 [Pseudolabrys sp.]